MLAVRELEDSEMVTQIGSRRRNGGFSFHSAPRPWREPAEEALSWVIGELDPRDARLAAFGPNASLSPKSDAVRHAQVGCLRSKGFRVDHDPYPMNQNHVLVRWNGDGPWDDRVSDLLHSCCSEGRCHG